MGKAWTQQEDEFLKQHIGEIPYKKIGEKIGRTEFAVSSRVSKIKKDMEKSRTKKWFKECLPILMPEEGEKGISKKLKIDGKEAKKIYKKWRYDYVNRIV